MKPYPLVLAAPFVAALALSTTLLSASPVTITLPEDTPDLKPGPGAELAQANCASCHSVDYIWTQPRGKGHTFWEAEVTKMVKVYGAPVAEADAKAIADYLAKAY